MRDVLELRRHRAALIQENRQILDRAETESRSLTAEETQEYDRRMQEIDALANDIQVEERQQALELELGASAGRSGGGTESPAADDRGRGPASGGAPEGRASNEYREAFRQFLRTGSTRAFETPEFRALQADADIAGGYLVAPQQMVMDLLAAVKDVTVVRQLARVIPVPSAASLGVPTLEHDVDDADWTSEIATGNEDTGMDFGKRDLHPHPLAKRIKVSNKLLRTAFLDVEAIVRDRLAYKFAVPQEKAFLTGSGAGEPLGVFTASAMGISTARDVAADNLATEIRVDNLKRVKWTLKSQYHGGARWVFHRDVFSQVDRLKDGEGQYLVQPDLQGGAIDRLLGFPVVLSEYAPNVMQANQYVGLLGDFRYYWIADALDMQIQRLVELYAETNQTGFIGRLECDGMPVLEEAFVRVKLGA